MNIRKEYTLPFPVARVYAAWISPKTVIPPATSMEVVTEIGGVYSVHVGDAHTEGVFEAIEPEHYLRYGWKWAGSEESTVVEVEFAANGANTDILIRHGGFTEPDSLAAHDAGWDSYVAGLNALLKAAG